MKKFNFFKLLIILILLFFFKVSSKAQFDNTWTVTALDNPAPGYLRFNCSLNPIFFLLDNYGDKQFLDTNNQRLSIYTKLLRNGLWITGGADKYYLYTMDMKLTDSIPFPLPEIYSIDFHETEALSNGHYLLLCQEKNFIDLSNIVPRGKKNAQVNSNVLVETDHSGTIFWQWKAKDYLKITDVTADIDLTQQVIDFTHINSFVEDNDSNLIISFRHLDEITKINKATRQLIWRFGGSMCKNNQFTFTNDSNNDNNGFKGFSHQHSISLLPNGNILMFDNGNLKNPQYSRAVEYNIDQVKKTATKVWEYKNSPPIYQSDMGSVFRLPNGNTLINWGGQQITEVKPDNSVAFELRIQSPTPIYKAYRLITRMNAVSKFINEIQVYDFNDSIYTTGVTINVASLTGSGLTAIEKHNYAPPTANYQGTIFTKILPYRWVFSQDGIKSISGTFKIKPYTVANIGDPSKIIIYKRDKESIGNFIELSTEYDSEDIYVNFNGFGEFVLGKIIDSPSLKIIAPNGGDTLVKDTIPKIIRWEQNFDGLIKIELMRNGELIQLIKDSISSPSGTFSWRIPPNVQPDNTYKIKITSVLDSTLSTISLTNVTIENITFVNEILPDNKEIVITNYPNPICSTTTFEFRIEEAGKTTISIFSLEGKELEIILNKYLESGNYKFNWESKGIETGIYFYKITSANKIKFEKIIIVK
ncbi:MAG: aryl-sulfate sulfotransferase [FCB group bacterium]|jgi:hypothetical protein